MTVIPGEQLGGMMSVLVTPFGAEGEVDTESLRSQVRHVLNWGAHGVVCFGLAGENYKLNDQDRRIVLTEVVDEVSGRVPVIAGTEHSGTEAAIVRSVEAQSLGASALMIYPPTFVKPDASNVLDYFIRIGQETDIPIIVQDAPTWTGVPLPTSQLTLIRESAPRVSWVKLEQPPIAEKATELSSSGFGIISGYGAVHLAEDLQLGIDGFMPGSALPGIYRDIWDAYKSGDVELSFRKHAEILALLSFQMTSLDTFVTVQKILLHRSGVIHDPRLRRPAVIFSPSQQRWLDFLLDHINAHQYLTATPVAVL